MTGISIAHRASLPNRVFWELKGHMSPSGSTTAGDNLSKSNPMGWVNLHHTSNTQYCKVQICKDSFDIEMTRCRCWIV